MKRDLIIIEAPFNLGLKAKNEHHIPGVYKLPQWLNKFGFHGELDPKEIINIVPPPYTSILDRDSMIRSCDDIIAYSYKLGDTIQKAIHSSQFPIVIGGDCSILIGCALGVRMVGQFGLFFIDGHTDFVPPEFSETKAAAGMDLYIVTGHAHPKISNMRGLQPYFEEKHVLALGNRYFDRNYLDYILSSHIGYFDLPSIRSIGPKTIAESFVQKVIESNLNGIWVHLDVDALDNNLMPAVDSPNADGLTYQELSLALESVMKHPLTKGINITILDPDLDQDGNSTKVFVKELTTIINKACT
jgi:arginase